MLARSNAPGETMTFFVLERLAAAESWARERRRALSAAVFGTALLLLFLLMNRELNIYDEAIVLVDALRVRDGDVIHRDFYSVYGPASYLILAGLFALFDPSFIVGRLFGITVMAGIITVTFYLVLPRVRLLTTLFFVGVCTLWMLAYPFYLYPLFPSLLMAMIGSAIIVETGRFPSRRALFLAGVSTGATALFRYDAGFFVLIAHMLALSLHVVSTTARPKRLSVLLRTGLVYGAGTAAIFMPFAIFFLLVAPLSAFIADIIDYPLHHYAAMRGLPFPGISEIIDHPAALGVYFPVLGVGLTLWYLWRERTRGSGSPVKLAADSTNWCVIVFALLSAVLFYKGVVRVHPLHMMMSTIPALLAVTIIVDRCWAMGGRARVGAGIAALVALVPPLAATGYELSLDMRDPGRTFAGSLLSRARSAADEASACSPSPSMRHGRLSVDYARTVNYLRQTMRPDDKLLAAVDHHDRILVNPVGLYFAAERLPGTHWHHYDPGLQTRSDIQAQMIRDLQNNDLRWVVRDASFDDVSEPNESSKSSGVHLLDRYIEANFRPVRRAGLVEIWLRNDVTAPVMKPDSHCLPDLVSETGVANPTRVRG